MLNEFIDVISSLNDGSVIRHMNNTDTEIWLNEADVKLYYNNNKYYFLSEYSNNYDAIEKKLKSNSIAKEHKELRPNNSYLILFYEIESFSEEISKRIITLEENEFFYKKYVFYYLKEEYASFIDWYNNLPEKDLSYILKNEQCSPSSKKLYMQFLLRLIIKVPFLEFEFKKMELEDFDNLLESQLDGIRNNKDSVKKMFDRITNELDNHSVNEIVDTLFSEIIGGTDNENYNNKVPQF